MIAQYMGEEIEGGMICVAVKGDRKIWISPAYHKVWKMLLPVAANLIEDLKYLDDQTMIRYIEKWFVLKNHQKLYECCVAAIKYLNENERKI